MPSDKKNRIPDLSKVDVILEVGGDKRFANPGKAAAAAPERLQNLIRHVEEHGYVIIPDAFTPSQLQEARRVVAQVTESGEGQPAAAKGRNSFEGVKTQRLYNMLNTSRVFDPFALHPDVLALNDHFLDPGYLLSVAQSINILPGEVAQTIHHDDGYATVPRPRRPFTAGVMIAIDDYTTTNGSTSIIPKSHLWGPDRAPHPSETQPAIMSSGSILYFLGTLFHGGGANTSDKARLAFALQYCQPWLRQLENMMLAVDWDRLDEMPPRLVDMLGYKVGLPFVGYVGGISPRAAVAKMMEKRRGVRKAML